MISPLPQLTVTTNGVPSICPNFNCYFEVIEQPPAPIIQAFTRYNEVVAVVVTNLPPTTTISALTVIYAASPCTIVTLDSGSPSTITCVLPYNLQEVIDNPGDLFTDVLRVVAGAHLPQVSLVGVGFLEVDPQVTPETIYPTIE